MSQIPPFHFEEHCAEEDGAFYASLGLSIHNVEQLLREIDQLFHFPGYFGFNWDALYDCLRDLSWITERQVVLMHAELPSIPEQELRIYLEVLRDAVLDWKDSDSHSLAVFFHPKDRGRIVELLGP
ncbi:barstar family protein [Comamonas squillarum]|uniref:Barstar family protein n=1 Tax=Comamonas squillarum TaxID=2977320 RepID=A0ABY5ZV93_9BURK|nr:barstar family protein [Comamonas sp. PR12]UXC17244.1 barstar family protein [Comamonas sp. PR12]